MQACYTVACPLFLVNSLIWEFISDFAEEPMDAGKKIDLLKLNSTSFNLLPGPIGRLYPISFGNNGYLVTYPTVLDTSGRDPAFWSVIGRPGWQLLVDSSGVYPNGSMIMLTI